MNIPQITKHEHGELATRIPIWLFNISFGIGTLLLILGLAFKNNEAIVEIGFFYMVIAFVINAIAFVTLLILSFVFTTHSNEIRLNTMLLLLNIPIAMLYAGIIISRISLLP